MSIEFRKTLDIDESNFQAIQTIGEHSEVDLINKSDREVDESALYNHLKDLEGVDRVESLGIRWTSRLKNVEIIKIFPNLQILNICGHNIISLDGLEWFQKGEYLNIETGRKKYKRNIEKITQTPIWRMCLDYGQKDDFSAIGKCMSLERLELIKSQSPEFYEWSNIPLNYLKFSQCKLTELRDTAHVKTLNYIMVGACNTFEKFAGDNSYVKKLIVDGCKRFDICSITTLPEANDVAIVDCAREITISELPEHPTITVLKIWAQKLNFDEYVFKKKFPKLKTLDIAKVKKADRVLLKEANMDIEMFIN